MTQTAVAPAPSASPTRGTGRESLLRRARWATVVVLGLAALVALALATSGPDRLLDPDDRGPSGGRALAEVLRAHGVQVEVARTIDEVFEAGADEDTTLLVADPQYLGPLVADELGIATEGIGRLVLVNPDSAQLGALGVPLAATPIQGEGRLDARCEDPLVRDGDTLGFVDVRLVPVDPDLADGARPCFGLDGPEGQTDGFGNGAALVTVPDTTGDTGTETVVLGFGTALTNRHVDERAHAGLGIRALGQHPRLVWFQPGLADLALEDDGTGGSPWPVWLGSAAAVLAFAFVVLALVRGRRLGRLVTEPLPVVVRAVETTESRGRLYRRARDTERASAVLRAGTRERLARRLAASPDDRDGLTAAVSSASGLPTDQVADLLHGPPPTHDRDLVSLATSLTDLEERAHPR